MSAGITVSREEVAVATEWLKNNTSIHPVWPLPTPEQFAYVCRTEAGRNEAFAKIEAREKKCRLEEEDAYHHGFELDWWKDADRDMQNAVLTCLFGGNGSAKTFFACARGVKLLSEGNKPRKVLFLHESETASIDVHQAAVYHYLKPAHKSLKASRTQKASVRYQPRTGFIDNRFVLPNGSIGQFGFYSQDVKRYEGTGWDLIVADEDFPLAWLKTLMFRLWRRKGVTGSVGQILWAFTPVNGITPAIRDVIMGAKMTETRKVDPRLLSDREVHVKGCPPGHMPYRMHSNYYNARLLFAFMEDSPWSGYEDAVKTVIGMQGSAQEMSSDHVKVRFFGWARNVVKTQFPKFSADVHIIKEAKVPKIVTRYLKIDPHGARNFFILWMAVDSYGRHYVEKEWPDYDDWAVTSENSKKYDGDVGPAQQKLGYGITEYKKLILKMEGAKWDGDEWDYTEHRDLAERFVDPRSGAQEALALKAGSASLIDRFYEEQTDKDGRIVGPAMDLRAASGQHEDEGLQAVTDLLDYDEMQEITPHVNEPRLYIVDSCSNLIWAMTNYTGQDGQKAACKDPLDCLRGLCLADLEHIDDKSEACTAALST